MRLINRIIPGEYRYPTIAPFTIPDGHTYLKTLEILVRRMKQIIDEIDENNVELFDLVVEVLNTKIDEINDAFTEFEGEVDDKLAAVDTKISDLETFVNSEISTLVTYVNDTVQQIINSSIEVQDPVVSGLVQDDTSDTHIAIDEEFAHARTVKANGVDDTVSLNDAIQAALANGETRVQLMKNQVYRVSAPIMLTSDSLDRRRGGVTLVGPAKIVPHPNFTGDVVVWHKQTPEQAAVNGFSVGAGLENVEIDGSLLETPNVSGVRFDGAFMPRLDRLYVHHMTGHGLTFPADNTINTSDDTYATPGLVLMGSKISNNEGWGVHTSRFASELFWIGNYVSGNQSGGVRLCGPRNTLMGGAIAYNVGVGIHFTRSDSGTQSQLSDTQITGIEIDRNTEMNIWFEHAFQCVVTANRFIAAEAGAQFDQGYYLSNPMVKFGGTPGMSAHSIRLVNNYFRVSQQTTDPELTIFEFNNGSDHNTVDGAQILGGMSENTTIGTPNGVGNVVRNNARTLVSTSANQFNGVVYASLGEAVTVSTALVDLDFSAVVLRYAEYVDGVYHCEAAEGMHSVEGFVTVDQATELTEPRYVDIHLRVDSTGSDVFSAIKIQRTHIPANTPVTNMVIPFKFSVAISQPNAKIKVAAVASTGTSFLGGAQRSELLIQRL